MLLVDKVSAVDCVLVRIITMKAMCKHTLCDDNRE